MRELFFLSFFLFLFFLFRKGVGCGSTDIQNYGMDAEMVCRWHGGSISSYLIGVKGICKAVL